MKDINTVVLVTADTLRYDAVPSETDDRSWCPFLSDLCDRGVDFGSYYASGPGTSSAFPGLLASAYPLDHGYRGLNDSHNPLAERLSEQGVRTVGITASSHASSLFNYDRGFDVFYDNPAYRRDAPNRNELSTTAALKSRLFDVLGSTPIVSDIGSKALSTVESLRRDEAASCPYERANTLTDRAVDILETEAEQHPNEDRFIWIHYMEPHAPYYPPDNIVDLFDVDGVTKQAVNELWDRWKEHRPPMWETDDSSELFDDRERRILEQFYKIQIRHLDREVQRLYDRIDSQWGFDNAALLFTSDHGEEFFEHGDLGHRAKVYDELVHVPFVCYTEGTSRTVDEITSHVDLGPTIADLLGRTADPEWRGESLVPLLAGRPEDWSTREYVVSEICHRSGYGGDVDPDEAIVGIVTSDWKYIRNNQIDTEELYGRGEPETAENNRLADHPAVGELRAFADERLSETTGQEVDRQEMSDDLRQQLHQLGYIDE